MLYPFITLPDSTEISYSELLHLDGIEQVRVFVEKWNDKRNAFDSLEVYLPKGNITQEEGFPPAVVKEHMTHIMQLKDVIFECAAEETQGINKE